MKLKLLFESEPEAIDDEEDVIQITNLKHRDYRYEQLVLNGGSDLTDAVLYARHIIKGRWPEAEKLIKKDPFDACLYADLVIGGRWPEAEETIKTSYNAIMLYTEHVIKGRWPEGEMAMLDLLRKNTKFDADDIESMFNYITSYVDGRWPEAEACFLKYAKDNDDAYLAYNCAVDIIQGRWPEAEEIIMKDKDVFADYTKFLKTGMRS